MAIQGLISFAGISGLPICGAEMTLAHGIGPSICQVRIPPQRGRLIEVGTLTWSYGGNVFSFPQCKVDQVDFERDGEGFEVWTLTILDRRWKWKFGEISGNYNVRRAGEIVPKTKKTARELCELCLKAMEEVRYDVSAVPNDQYPEVEWNYANPAECLARLADEMNCRVVMRLNNSVAVMRVGQGQFLPRGGPAFLDAATVDPPERPDSLIFVGDRVLWQMDLVLEAVAREPDGRIVPLNNVSWAPQAANLRRNGFKWALADLQSFDQVAVEHRERAKKEVFRLYRVVANFTVPVYGGRSRRVQDLNDILPLENEQIQKDTDPNTEELKRKEAVVWGIFGMHDAGEFNSNEVKTGQAKQFVADLTKNPEAVYDRGFRIIANQGLVEFSEPIFQYRRTNVTYRAANGQPLRISEAHLEPANIRLRTAFGIRDAKTQQWLHASEERRSNQRRFGTRPEHVKRNDVQLTWIHSPRNIRWESSEREYKDAAKFYLDQAELKYGLSTPQGVSYAGLLPINPDGAIQQVSWSIGPEGATTRASRNREEELAAKSYTARRQEQRLIADAARAAEVARAQEARLRGRK